MNPEDLLQQIHVAEILLRHAPHPGDPAESAQPVIQFWESLAPRRQREIAALAEPPLPLPDRAGAPELARFLGELARRLPDVPPRELAGLYRRLSTPVGRDLAGGATAFLDQASPLERELAERMIFLLACLVPDALDGLHERILRLGVVWPGEIFRGSDPAVRDLLLELLPEAEEVLPFLLSALAWIGDSAVCLNFQQWRREPPLWTAILELSADQHTLDAAWHLRADGSRRELALPDCLELVPAEEGGGHGAGPVRVIAPHEESCSGCAAPLVSLFDIDLTDPRTAFLGLDGSRLRIATCPACLPYSAPLLTEVDLEGRSVWSPANEPPSFVGDQLGALPAERLVLGEPQPTPVAARPFASGGPASQLGGHPSWHQEPEYPLCPECGEPMPFFGQVHLADLGEPVDGIVFAFLCAPCGRAATLYQQS